MENFDAHSTTLALHQSILAMMILSGSKIDETQRIPILSPAASGSLNTSSDNNDAFFTQITYEKFASALRQCDKNSGQMYT